MKQRRFDQSYALASMINKKAFELMALQEGYTIRRNTLKADLECREPGYNAETTKRTMDKFKCVTWQEAYTRSVQELEKKLVLISDKIYKLMGTDSKHLYKFRELFEDTLDRWFDGKIDTLDCLPKQTFFEFLENTFHEEIEEKKEVINNVIDLKRA